MTTDTKSNNHKFIAGFLSGITTTCLTYPTDIFRVRTFLKVPIDVKTKAGLSKLFHGFEFTVGAAAVKNLGTYSVQDISRNYFRDQNFDRKTSQILSSITSGTILGVIATPLNAIKVPLQTSAKRESFLKVSKNIYNIHGLAGFFRGGSTIVARDLTWAFFYFTSFDYIDFYVDNKILSSLAGGVISTAASYPLDGMRLYKQHYYNQTKNIKKYSAIDGFKESFKLNPSNIRSFTTSIVRVPICITISHMSYLYYVFLLSKNE